MKPNTISEKTNLHSRNLHRDKYNFSLLVENFKELSNFVFINNHGVQSVDFSNPDAVIALNKALLYTYYDVTFWDIPQNYLCPPIPGRVDYIHYLADLLAESNNGIVPNLNTVIGLDVGIGANCIYPILGNAIYNWSFVGSEIDNNALENCKKIIKHNPKLIDSISLHQQVNSRFIFKDIILPEDKFAFTICNPPFHSSKEEANKSTLRKINNLEKTKTDKVVLNFGGKNNELWCDGGEMVFITQMIYESVKYQKQCLWFTTLVSKNSNIKGLYKLLNKVKAVSIKTIEMSQGQKTSRIIAWSFLSDDEKRNWKY